MTYRAALCGGIDRTGCKAACQIAAAVLNAGNAARIIRSGNVCVDIAVLNMTDDRAFALLQLAADAACTLPAQYRLDRSRHLTSPVTTQPVIVP